MKILLLSLCGKLNEPEEIKYLDLYFASLKKNVVPYFDTKVIMLNTWKVADNKSENSQLIPRIKEFGLENVVEVKNIYELDLPQESIDFLESRDWFGRIGLHMNILRDYSLRNDFFGAEWIFHTDTDIEFLQNFNSCLTTINMLVPIHPKVMITCAGDSFPYNIIANGKEYTFEDPIRLNMYEPLVEPRKLHDVGISVVELKEGDYRLKYKKPVFNIAQMKVRNDFVGMSLEVAKNIPFNWVSCNYPYDFQDGGILSEFWPTGDNQPEVRINYDKGGPIQYRLHEGSLDLIRLALPGYHKMAQHYGSGWFMGHFLIQGKESLERNYSDTKHIWSKDFEEPVEVVEEPKEIFVGKFAREEPEETIGNMTKSELIALIQAAVAGAK